MTPESNTDTHYFPDKEEVFDTIEFMTVCQDSDLLECWKNISSEWDPTSLIAVHKSLCKTGRIKKIVEMSVKN